MPLCQSCAKFDILSIWKKPDAAITLPLKLVVRAASQCEFCSLICEQFEGQIANITNSNEPLSDYRIWLLLQNDASSQKPKFTSFLTSLCRTDIVTKVPFTGLSKFARQIGIQIRIASSQGIIQRLMIQGSV